MTQIIIVMIELLDFVFNRLLVGSLVIFGYYFSDEMADAWMMVLNFYHMGLGDLNPCVMGLLAEL